MQDTWKEEITNPFYIVCFILMIFFCVDYFRGSLLTIELVKLQLSLFNSAPTGDVIHVKTLFGTFHSITSMGKFFNKSLGGIFLAYSSWYFIMGLWDSITKKKYL